MKLTTIIGARPQIIKASALSRAIRNSFSDKLEEVIIHTGQHYDQNMSEVFFTELDIPRPRYNLAVGSGKHGKQTALMTERLEEVFEAEKPDAVVVYGDTNSTLAAAIAASKMLIPIVHIEAGLRSFNKSMPEEINRILCDHVSTLLFSPTQTGYDNLVKEGFSQQLSSKATADSPNIYHCGDIMYDNTLFFEQKAELSACKFTFCKPPYALCTIHRNSNTDNKARMQSIFEAILQISRLCQIILPLHPRTKKMMPQMLSQKLLTKLQDNSNIKIIEPVSFLDMIYLEKHSSLILTDSGGVQKEAYFLKRPSVILRSETEWQEIVQQGNAFVCDADRDLICQKADAFLANPLSDYPPLFGDGKAGDFICQTILDTL
ncbi:MAG: non-hydrolyzing UDP-N-acetylglucosamine 2-epimerase [Candidatus Onthomorpha sp.]